MVILFQVLYIGFCIGLAYINYKVIEANERVYHGINGGCHALYWATAFWLTGEWLMLLILPLLGAVVFDIALNKFRGLPLDYTSQTSKSLVDKWERKTFGGDGYAPKVIYLILLIFLNLFL